MATNTISISVIGDREYVNKIKILGMRLDKPISALVRDALDARYGDQLSRIQLDGEGHADATTNAPR
ncbi:MAG TPA: hypothetical protein PLZ51_08000 [Aggregatilineales bacterium]|nr:hypothetical protein [Aggregatilineales bacterium]